MRINLLYFAWVRERIGTAAECVDVPDERATVGALLAWLAEQSPAHADALADREAIRVAVDQQFADDQAMLRAGSEVAIFPPVTGG